MSYTDSDLDSGSFDEPTYEFFEEKCCICNQQCNELSGWKCEQCNNCYCDEHNCEEFTCNC